jgi:DNA-binding FadR family transcriptional regulator
MPQPSDPAKFERLYTAVFARIGAGQYRPGDRIGIKDLAAQLNVSTTPLREVLSRLVGRGIVEERRSEGFYLARIDARDLADLYALHSTCVLRALHLCRGTMPKIASADTGWTVFARIAEQAGDRAVADVRAFLEDRLTVVRRLENQTLSDTDAEAARLRGLIAGGDVKAAALAIRRYHGRRRAISAELALATSRGTTDRKIY